MSWQPTASDVISLAINFVQNGQDCRELRPDLAHLMGGSETKPRGRGQSGDGPASDAIRILLEELYREILRANGLGRARALAESMGEELLKRDRRPPSRSRRVLKPRVVGNLGSNNFTISATVHSCPATPATTAGVVPSVL